MRCSAPALIACAVLAQAPRVSAAGPDTRTATATAAATVAVVPEARTSTPAEPALRISGYVQADAVLVDQTSAGEVNVSTGEPLNNTRFLIRRARLRAEVRWAPAPVKILYRCDFTQRVEQLSLGPQIKGIDEEEVIRAARIEKESVQVAIRTEEGRRIPGTQGDTLKVVQNLPRRRAHHAGSGQLIVWGSAAKDTRVLVDGVELPSLYHLGGLRSVETRPLPKEGLHGFVAADVLDASALITQAFGDRLRIGAAARYGYLDTLPR